MAIKFGDKRIKKNFPKNINKYSGKWVAFIDNVIVENQETLRGLVEILDKKRYATKHQYFLYLLRMKDHISYLYEK